MEVLIISRSEYLSNRISGLLSSVEDISLITQSLNSHSLSSLVQKLNPELIIIDVYPDKNNNLMQVKKISASHPGIEFILLVDDSPKQYIESLKEFGIRFCIDKTENMTAITEIVKNLSHINNTTN